MSTLYFVGHSQSSLPSLDSYVSELKERYFDKKQIQFKKDYFVTKEVGSEEFQSTLTIPEVVCVFISEKSPSKSSAENIAAKTALEYLKLL